jgi:hypothetical protein
VDLDGLHDPVNAHVKRPSADIFVMAIGTLIFASAHKKDGRGFTRIIREGEWDKTTVVESHFG